MTPPVRPLWAPDPIVTSSDWWRQPVVYQVNPPSFAATGVHGAGTLRGVTARIPYLAALGIDAVWLSPFDPSALADDGPDGGPDVLAADGDVRAAEGGVLAADGTDEQPRPGTLADFDALASGLDAYGIKVIVDLVPNCPAFDFELLEADWDAGAFLQGITDSRQDSRSGECPPPGSCPAGTRTRGGPARRPC